ncbi:MAG: CapA family protein [Lachnospiraceae bacterium]|nr:CapA family protein [Lachnospiraceae bacterium]
MDNEEIKKLLQELKKNSDESTAVRSKVVKIHMDTPAEAARRRRAKERAEAEEARKRASEEEKARAAEEARRLEAERMAREVVEEAKLQAKSGFSSDLEEDLLAQSQDLTEEEFGESADDLDLNWEYERPRLSTDAPYEEEEDSDETGEEDPDYMSDSDEFRDGIIPDDSNPLRSALGAIKGGFASLTERLREKGPKEDSEDEEEETQEPEESEDSEEPADSALSTEPAVSAGSKEQAVPAHTEEPAVSARTEESSQEPADSTPDPDEEWKRRMEEPPAIGRKRRKRVKGSFSDLFKRTKKKPAKADSSASPEEKDKDFESGEEMPDDRDFREEFPDDADFLEELPDDGDYREELPDDGDYREELPDDGDYREELPDDRDFREELPDDRDFREELPDDGEAAGEEEASEPKPEKRIEVIDLEEKANNKEAEVIPLDPGTTGPLPQFKAGKFLPGMKTKNKDKENSKKTKSRKRFRRKAEGTASGEPPKEKEPNETWLRIRNFVYVHRKQCLIGLAALLVLIVVLAAIALILPNLKSKRRAVVRVDQDLTVQILSQPDSFTPEGDVSLRVKAPETIQSITINGENVDIKQGRTVDFDYHAQTGALEMMAVSTDKVRSADITLAYVDSQPPVVTVTEKNGTIELTAEDKETGVKAIYVGRKDGLSTVPMYEEYTEPIPANPDEVISYYAVDEAGNSSTPAISAMVPATQIAFGQKRYGIFPGSETTLQIVTTPENAFVNNLTFEIENDKIAKVNGNVLTGISEGDTTITASADGLDAATAKVSVKADRSVTISAVGDCTLGTDVNLSQNTSFNAYQAMYGNSYFFEKVKPILSQDDATFANFEGTLTTLDESYRKDKPFAFKADPSFAQILNEGSIEVVTLANNHTYDYGDQSTLDTKDALDAAGVNWCSGEDISYMDLNGVKTAFIGIYALENGLESMDLVQSTIAEAKENGADLVIIHFHWGVELVTTLDDFERQLAHAAVDAGADLVLGTHAHMLLPVEKYNGRYIVYGLANFCFGGNANPHSYDSMIWQQTFTFTPDGLESEDDISIIPIRVSSDRSINNYQPMPVNGDEADAIIQTLNSLSTEFGLTFDQYLVDGTTITE